MAEYSQGSKDYCLLPNTDHFLDHQVQYMEMDLTTIQQRGFQQNNFAETITEEEKIVKEEPKGQTVNEQSFVEGSTSKSMMNRQGSVEIISPSLKQVPICKRRKRTVYNQSQLTVLEQFFQSNMYPDIHRREELAKLLLIPESRIQVWFQNRRGKARREKNRSGAINKIHPPISHTPMRPTLAQSEQHQPMLAQRHGQASMNLQKTMIHRPLSPMPYPPHSFVMTQERMMMNQVLPISYYQSPHANNQQHLYRNVTSMNTKEEVNQSCRHNHMPAQVNYMVEFSTIRPNKTITPDMNITIPPIPMSADSKGPSGINPFTDEFSYNMSNTENDVYGE